MNIDISKRALKDIKKLPSKIKGNVEDYIFLELTSKTLIEFLSEVEKLSGYDNYYKKRIGDYRLGFYIKGDYVFLMRVLNRKDIYKFFP